MKEQTFEFKISSDQDFTAAPAIFPKKRYKVDYTRLFHPTLVRLAIDKELTGTDLRVFLAVVGHLNYENFLNMSQQALADVIGIKQQDVSKSLKKLVNKGYMEITGQIGRQNIYRVDPHLVHRGRAKSYKRLCESWDEAI